MATRLKICTLAVIVLAIASFCDAQVYQFRCFQQATYAYTHTGDTNWVDTNYVVRVDIERKKVELRAQEPRTFTITDFDPLQIAPTGNTIVCSAVDKEGSQCKIELTLFRQISFHIATLVIRYPNLITSYRLMHPKK